MIYLDNAATTMKKPQCVIDAVVSAMTTFGNASRGAHESALTTSRVIYQARKKVATFFNCPKSEQVAFTCNSTEALNIAIFGALREGDHVITTELEHNSVLRPLFRMASEKGIRIDFVKADRNGSVRCEDFYALFRPDTRAVVCTHASNLTGNRLDIARIGALCDKRGALLIVDASQTAGATPIDMEAMKISILCFTGHKSMMAPQGTGGICIRGDIDVRPFKTGGTGVQSFLRTQPEEYPTRLEAGTLNGHGIAGLSAAVDYLNEVGVSAVEEKETGLMRRFYEAVVSVPKVKIYGDYSGNPRSPIVALNIGTLDSAIVADELATSYGIATRAGAHCAPLMHKALGTEEQGAVRFSFGWFNTESEVDEAARAVREIAQSIE
ncbi:MAG: aminotransferase class V-fold PLP-dependent enzyme [Clostridia bacterium]|nr:aminotransferase class V-fold PLP-dependent enzyme [Clostridia bacterium]MBR0445458.1 aminotransferase class V-fold PLP-dependent enzyme [Clostridia bacterium]